MGDLWHVVEATSGAIGADYAPALVRALTAAWDASAVMVLLLEGENVRVIAGQAQQRMLNGETFRLAGSVFDALDGNEPVLAIKLDRSTVVASVVLPAEQWLLGVSVPTPRGGKLFVCAACSAMPDGERTAAGLLPFAVRALAELDWARERERLVFLSDPMTTLLGNLDVALDTLERRGEGDAELLEMLQDASDAARRVARVLRSTPDHDRDCDEPSMATLADLDPAVESALVALVGDLRRRARIVTQLGARPQIESGHTAGLVQVVLHLLLNTAQALPDGRGDTHEVRVATGTADGRAFIELVLAQNLTADPSGDESPVSRPAQVLKDVAARAQIRDAAALLGGTLQLVDASARASALRVVFDASVGPAAESSTELIARRSARLLLIDDDTDCLRTLCRTFAAHHELVVASSVRDAMHLLARGEASFDAIFCAAAMANASGAAIHRAVMQGNPTLSSRFIFVARGSFSDGVSAYVSETLQPIVFTPLQPSDLLRALAMVNRAQTVMSERRWAG